MTFWISKGLSFLIFFFFSHVLRKSFWLRFESLSSSVVSDSLWPVNHRLPRPSVHRIPQARILQWVAISFSRGSSWPRDWGCTAADSLLSEPPGKPTQMLPVCTCARFCPTLCSSMDRSLPGSSVNGIFQARILEWVAIRSSRGSSWPRDQTHTSCVSCNGRQLLYHCTTWEALSFLKRLSK